jgi:hypothetical protein
MAFSNLGLLCFYRGCMGLVVIILSACSYQGGGDQPVIRKFTWFSYIEADDIRAKCKSSSNSQYRFVYNGVYNEQVRTYDIYQVEKGRYEIKINVTEEADVSSITLNLEDPDLFQPWNPRSSITNVSVKQINLLERTLKNVGFFVSSPPSGNLTSIDFYWVVSACTDQKFRQNAYIWPEEKFKNAAFPKLLSIWDFTDIPINPPRDTSNFSIYGTTETKNFRNHFNLKFGSDGLLGNNLIR